MNSCILMAEIVRSPELRYTSDNVAIVEMLVKFPSMRTEEPPATLKVVAWRNLAEEVNSRYKEGDFVIIQGRLSMNTIERKEGFREKRAELVVNRIWPVEASLEMESLTTSKTTATSSAPTTKVVALNPRRTAGADPASGKQSGSGSVSEAPSRYAEQKAHASEEFDYQSSSEPSPGTSSPSAGQSEEDLDEIPF